jgi:hypothetical protein
MSSFNPSVTINDIIADVEARLSSPNLDVSFYLPIISSAAQRVYQAIISLGQEAKEFYFGADEEISLTQNTLEHDIYTDIPDFDSFVDVEVQYGASGDTRNHATKLRSPSQWNNKANVSTTYRAKESPLYYKSGDNIGVIPTPPESGAIAYVRYVRKIPQYTDGLDVVEIPYTFMWAITDYVQAKAIQRVNEDYSTARQIEEDFDNHLQEITERAADKVNENDGTNSIEISTGDAIFDDPMGSL